MAKQKLIPLTKNVVTVNGDLDCVCCNSRFIGYSTSDAAICGNCASGMSIEESEAAFERLKEERLFKMALYSN
jgi:hypothetical protein